MSSTHEIPTADARIRVLLVEDHTIVREGLRMLLEGHDDLCVVGEASDGQAAVREAMRLRPDVVLMDLSLPLLNGVDATRHIVRDAEGTRVLVLSMHSGEDHVRPALRAGASGFLVKGSGVADLVAGIRAVARGEAFLSPAAAAVMVRSGKSEAMLTPREREVLQLVAEGRSTADVARTLRLSVKTIEGHRSRLMAKLGAPNAVTLVRHAVRLGLVSPE